MADRPKLDIAPFALPNTPAGELRFEEPREIVEVVAYYDGGAPQTATCQTMHKYWPEAVKDFNKPLIDPTSYGWVPEDDLFMSSWQEAKADVRRLGEGTIAFSLKNAVEGFSSVRTLGIKIDPPPTKVEVFTTGSIVTSRILVTGADQLMATPYNAELVVTEKVGGAWRLTLRHSLPRAEDSNDDAHVLLDTGSLRFTIPVGVPVLFEGVYATPEGGPDRAEYEAQNRLGKTVMEQVREHAEQTLGGAMNGQPRAHRVGTNIGWPYSRLRFKVEPNADLYLNQGNVTFPPLNDTPRYKAKGQARFFFGLDEWQHLGMWPDPAPSMATNHRFRRGNVECEVRSFCVPLLRAASSGELEGEEPTVALMRFRFRNVGSTDETARLAIGYSQESRRDENPYFRLPANEWLVPDSPRDDLTVEKGVVTSDGVLRAVVRTEMASQGSHWSRVLKRGEECELVLKVPFLEPNPREKEALDRIDFSRADADARRFWRSFAEHGAQLQTPEPILNELHTAHAAHVAITDFMMPGGEGLINTSVGTSTYGNFSNESVMIVSELESRGLHNEARRRLDLWIKYQGTAEQPGNFTDYDGMFFGAGGFEQGAYNQHHGWVLWALCEHFLYTRDRAWLDKALPAILKGTDWILRQRKNTIADLPHSRGWERGFMPAGSLEDVTDYHYWLVVNAVMARAVEATAHLLETIDHPQASRYRSEADAFRVDLLKGFAKSREHSPLVRLRNGRWVTHDPSRLYRRGRDVGWIRETLEGSMYLILTGLLDPKSKEADAIMEDYHDNRFTRPPYGYVIRDWDAEWFNLGGFSIQPNLLATPDAHIARDEPELFLWTFFNSWAACYREEIGAMVEHPMPILGFSNNAHFKTSDQANAIRWLRSMLVYADDQVLHFGRALPKGWVEKGTSLEDAATPYGVCSVSYRDNAATVKMRLHESPKSVLVRFRTDKPFSSATVNGQTAEVRGQDVVLPAKSGEYRIVPE
jgi:hypothetical protein